MPSIDLLSQDKKKVGTVNLNDSVFGVEINIPLVHQVIKAQLADRRQGTAKTKTKSEIRGGGRKPFRQKGTGNARRGSSRSPLIAGGGQNFGPIPRSYEQATPKKMMDGALRSVLSDRCKEGRLLIVDEFKLASMKTKAFAQLLNDTWQIEKVLIVDEENKNLEVSARNIKHCKVIRTEGLNCYDIVGNEWLVMTKRSVERIEARLAN